MVSDCIPNPLKVKEFTYQYTDWHIEILGGQLKHTLYEIQIGQETLCQ